MPDRLLPDRPEIDRAGSTALQTGPKPSGAAGRALPRADMLVVTWTIDEGHAVSRVLTPDKDSRLFAGREPATLPALG
jgi:hypothetical protein